MVVPRSLLGLRFQCGRSLSDTEAIAQSPQGHPPLSLHQRKAFRLKIKTSGNLQCFGACLTGSNVIEVFCELQQDFDQVLASFPMHMNVVQTKRHNQRGEKNRTVWKEQPELFEWVQIRQIGLAQEEKGLWLNLLHIKSCTFVWFQNIFVLKLTSCLFALMLKG